MVIHLLMMKAAAAQSVQQYAVTSAPNVSRDMVDAICRALGTISVDEAIAALDRLQAESTS